MKGPSDYVKKLFAREFRQINEFWTGDDGDLVAVALSYKHCDESGVLRQLRECLLERGITEESIARHWEFRIACVERAPIENPDQFAGNKRVAWRITDDSNGLVVGYMRFVHLNVNARAKWKQARRTWWACVDANDGQILPACRPDFFPSMRKARFQAKQYKRHGLDVYVTKVNMKTDVDYMKDLLV